MHKTEFELHIQQKHVFFGKPTENKNAEFFFILFETRKKKVTHSRNRTPKQMKILASGWTKMTAFENTFEQKSEMKMQRAQSKL